ncbi:hypothetical protein T03_59 [Trichinella britovi]|uniref:DUF5641 domain-containing protein n=1 Tax=Trichinella britovi TaxID=45882 RepID=A0A0V1CQ81_TRIBR|nr:hypothetical protein T03_59 [Trichinella britovi]
MNIRLRMYVKIPCVLLFENRLKLDPGFDLQQKSYLTRRWRYQQRTVSQFCKRWRPEYIVNSVQRNKWIRQKRRPKKGDILLMKQEGVPKNPYPLGRIIECYEG